jgi:hypothetical protein
MARNYGKTAGQSEEQVKRQSAKRKRQSPIKKLTKEVAEFTKKSGDVSLCGLGAVPLRVSFFAAREEKQILRFAQDDMSF